MHLTGSFIALLLGCALPLLAASAQADTSTWSYAGQVPVPAAPLQFAQRQCSQRIGPFVTQSTAWQRLRQAERQGYAVSGVFPCYGAGGRGYCFNVFFPC